MKQKFLSIFAAVALALPAVTLAAPGGIPGPGFIPGHVPLHVVGPTLPPSAPFVTPPPFQGAPVAPPPGGGSETGGGASGKSGGQSSGKSGAHRLLKQAAIAGIAVIAAIVIYCIVTEDETDTREDKFCKRQPEPEPFPLELVGNTTNLYARQW